MYSRMQIQRVLKEDWGDYGNGAKGPKLTRNALPSPQIHVFRAAYVGAPEFVQRGFEFRALFSAREVYRSARFPTKKSIVYLQGFTP